MQKRLKGMGDLVAQGRSGRDLRASQGQQSLEGVARYGPRSQQARALQRVELIPMHVPGTTLVEEGIDRASRKGDEL